MNSSIFNIEKRVNRIRDKILDFSKTDIFTPLRISNAHGNVAIAHLNRPKLGDLNVQWCKNLLSGPTKVKSQKFRNSVTDSSVKIDELYYFLDSPNLGEATVTLSLPSYTFANAVIPKQVDYNGKKYKVVSIGETAFRECSSLTSVTIPDSVITIDTGAFQECTNLTSVIIGNSVTTIGDSVFFKCTSLTSVTIPDSVITIGLEAFFNCTNLTSVIIGNSVTTIGYQTFAVCSSLTSVTIPDSVITIDTGAFQECTNLTSVIIGNSVTTIGDSVFFKCTSLTSVTIPDSVITIGLEAFAFCASSTSIIIGNSVTTIGERAFGECRSLIFIAIPDSLTSINNGLFLNCTSLTSVTIPDSVITIGIEAFFNCTNLTSVIIGNSVTTIGYQTFAVCSSLTSVTIPDSVITIDTGAFQECTNLTSVIIGNSVTTIGYQTFAICSSLTSVTIPDSVITIDTGAFQECTNLTSVIIGNSVTTIGYQTFAVCSSLTSVTIPDSVITIGEFAFYECSSLTSVYFNASGNYYLPAMNIGSFGNNTVNFGTAYYYNNVKDSNGNTISDYKDYFQSYGFADAVNRNPPIPSNICFPGNTPVKTDQGEIAISKINSNVNTIRGKKIVAITQTISNEKYLVCFEKDAIAKNVPSQNTLISMEHKLYYKGFMKKADWFVRNFYNVTFVPYTGEVLYNVLLENHETMIINNLICETLHPKNKISKIYNFMDALSKGEHGYFTSIINNTFCKKSIKTLKSNVIKQHLLFNR